jgi:hypothetical protein
LLFEMQRVETPSKSRYPAVRPALLLGAHAVSPACLYARRWGKRGKRKTGLVRRGSRCGAGYLSLRVVLNSNSLSWPF